jgi:hypothetical protein
MSCLAGRVGAAGEVFGVLLQARVSCVTRVAAAEGGKMLG